MSKIKIFQLYYLYKNLLNHRRYLQSFVNYLHYILFLLKSFLLFLCSLQVLMFCSLTIGKRIKFFTRKFVPVQGTKVPESLQAMRKARVMI